VEGGTVDPVGEYHRLLAADPASAAEQAAWLREAFARRGITFAGEPMASFLRPHFLARESWDDLRSAAVRLAALAVRVARRAFDGDVRRLCAWLGTPEAEARWVSLDPGEPDVVLSRVDAFLTSAGPRAIEINSDAPAGFGYGDRMAEVFAELPVFAAFARRLPVTYPASAGPLVAAVRAAAPSVASPVVAIVDFCDVKTRADQAILRETFQAAGVTARLADPRELELGAGRLIAGGEAVDVVYRRAVLSELLEREDEVRPFLTAYRERRAVFVNSFRCRLSEDKAFLALLTDEAFGSLLADDERAFSAELVPWTRKLEERRTLKDGREVDLVPFVIAARERLVLKPAHAYGGRSVLVGDETPPGEWEAAVHAGLGRPWVVQERVPIPEEPFPVLDSGGITVERLKVNVNPFYVRGADAGAIARVSRSSVINVTAGGGSVPTFLVG
jgi:uncharacterized circularly permuted ATP-grasp superfamily protein